MEPSTSSYKVLLLLVRVPLQIFSTLHYITQYSLVLNETIGSFRHLFGISLVLRIDVTALYTFRDHNSGLLKIIDSEHVLILPE